MVDVVFEERTCPGCRGEGWRHGPPHPRQPKLCELRRCPLCGGAGSVRQALLVRVPELEPAA